MKPSKIIIEGDYWDCQIYRGRLYLWTIDGMLKVVNWYSLIRSIEANINQHLPLTCAFTEGNYLYNYSLKTIFHDPDFKKLLQQKFISITKESFVIEERHLNKHLIGCQNNPFNELQVDTEISANRLYALTENALKSVTAHRNGQKYPVSSKTVDHFSINAFTFKANNYSKFAISAGSDGLYEFDALTAREGRFRKGDDYVKKVIDAHSSFADYSFLSIYNSSLVGSSCMAYQLWDEKLLDDSPSYLKMDRNSIKLESLILEEEIFKTKRKSKLSWGTNEKLYRATDEGIELVRFRNYTSGEQKRFSEPMLVSDDLKRGNIISARTAYFGSIIEYDNAIVVLLSDDTEYIIDGQITRWRIYPRSFNYENHLHVIKDDCIEIYSFNNDYFIDQEEKALGISYKIKAPFVRRKRTIEQDLSNLSDTSKGNDDGPLLPPNLADLPF